VLIKKTYQKQLIGYILRDFTEIEAHEKLVKKDKTLRNFKKRKENVDILKRKKKSSKKPLVYNVRAI
jgi:hypothetical protein